MSIQNKLAKSQIKIRNRLHDFMISQTGTKTKVVRLKVLKNLEGDAEDIEVVSHDELTVVIDYSEELPLTRLRKNLLTPQATTSNVYLYDILPIMVFARYDNMIDRDDILIRKLNVYNDTFYHVIQITETLGNFNGDQLTMMKYQSAPYTYPFTQEVADIVSQYLES